MNKSNKLLNIIFRESWQVSWQRPKKALKPQNFQNKLFHLIQAPFLLINGQNEESFIYFENESFYPNMTVGSLIKPCFWSGKFLVKWYCYDIDTQLYQYFVKIREDQNGMMTTSFPFEKKKKRKKKGKEVLFWCFKNWHE